MARTNTYCCVWCKQSFIARVADRKRGWARFCSKHCKAMQQEKRTHQNADYLDRKRDGRTEQEIMHDDAMLDSTTSHGQDGTSGR